MPFYKLLPGLLGAGCLGYLLGIHSVSRVTYIQLMAAPGLMDSGIVREGTFSDEERIEIACCGVDGQRDICRRK